MHSTLAIAAILLVAGCAGPSSTGPRGAGVGGTTGPRPGAGDVLSGTPGRFTASCRRDVQRARAEVARLLATPLPREPVAALTAYDEALALLDDAAGRAAVAANAHPDAAFRAAAEGCEQEAKRARTDLSLDHGLYEALASLELAGQDAATRRWVERVLRGFRRAGVDRDPATRERLKALHERLTRLGQEFGRHIHEDVRHVDLLPEELEGLPEDYVRAHPPGPDGRVRITTDTADSVPFMAYARSSRAREALWRANRKRGHPANLETLSRLLQARHALATLLGYPSWAAYTAEDSMVRQHQVAADFIERLADATAGRVRDDYAVLLERKRRDSPGATVVEPWEQAWLEDRVRAEQYRFDSREVRPYFEYTRVKQGVLDITSRLFGLTYRRADAPVWHPDVEAWDVYEGGTVLGRFYLDMHPRPGKFTHAAQWDLATGRAGKSLPEGVLTCNFPRPGKSPALLHHSDVRTFFHEFGHLLHHILGGRARWAGLSGSRTEHDFVEAPAQVLEEWAWRPESLRTFARHFRTGEPLPEDTIARMRRANAFGKGLWLRQQLFYAAVSLHLHDADPAGLDTTARVKSLQARYMPFQPADDTYAHLSFTQLEGTASSSAYYAYLWSLVIARDLLTPFQRRGLMDPATARRYRDTVLGPGGSRDAADLVRDFLGRDYGFEAYTRWLEGD